MILYCHVCYMDGDWIENISGESFIDALYLESSEFGFGNVVYVGF